MAARNIEQITVGESYSEEVTLDAPTITRFVELTQDRAGIHINQGFSESKGFSGLVTHGFLLAARFSRILGMELPGENTVIGSVELNFHAPVYQGDTVRYTVKVTRVLMSLGTVALDLKIEKVDGTPCVAGKATCAFKRI